MAEEKSSLGTLTSEETLRYAIENGIININDIAQDIENMHRKELLDKHPFSIWQNEQGIWMTYLPDEDKGRVFRKRKTREELENLIIEFYRQQEEKIFINDVFREWIEMKLKYGEIQKQTYDRYNTDFERFFLKHSISKKLFKNITYNDLEDFIKFSIHKFCLTRKSYSNLRLLVRGIFKYGKNRGYTELSMTEFFGDLELSKNIFQKKIVYKQDEVFMEDEIPIIIRYLKNHVDIWNLGLLLQFQTGMRIGEIAALKHEDIKNNCICVSRAEVKYKNEDNKWTVGIQNFAKTMAGNRQIFIPDSAVWTLEQIKELNPHGEYLFMNKGKRIRENTFNKRLAKVCEELKLNHRTTHKIRKTYGTTLLDNNVNDSFVSEQMGHTDVATTRKLYYYSNKSEKTKISQINKAISF